MNAQTLRDARLQLTQAVLFSAVTVLLLGVLYPLVFTVIAQVLFPFQANGSMRVADGRIVGSTIVGQSFTTGRYFHGRPSAAGKNGYDPTSTGGTNLGPTSRKLIDATRAAIADLQRHNPNAAMPIPMDLVTSSASGIDPDISPQAAQYQAPRVAAARHLPLARVRALVASAIRPRELGFLGEPHVNVLELNLALDGLH